MAQRPVLDISKYRLDEYRSHGGRHANGPATWQQFRNGYRDLPLRVDSSPLRITKSPSSPLFKLGLNHAPASTKRTQSPLQKYRSNPDLFYQTLGVNNKSPPRTVAAVNRTLSLGLGRTRVESGGSETMGVLKRRLNDVLKLDDLVKSQEIVAEMTPEDLSKLPQKYVDELRKTIELLDSKVKRA